VRFWDTSGLVPLLLEQAATVEVVKLLEGFRVLPEAVAEDGKP